MTHYGNVRKISKWPRTTNGPKIIHDEDKKSWLNDWNNENSRDKLHSKLASYPCEKNARIVLQRNYVTSIIDKPHQRLVSDVISNLRLNSHDSSLLEHLDRMMTTSEKNCNPEGLWLTCICCHLVSDLPTFFFFFSERCEQNVTIQAIPQKFFSFSSKYYYYYYIYIYILWKSEI